MFAAGGKVVTWLVWRGTHTGPYVGVAATGKRAEVRDTAGRRFSRLTDLSPVIARRDGALAADARVRLQPAHCADAYLANCGNTAVLATGALMLRRPRECLLRCRLALGP